YEGAQSFATPRRLALHVIGLPAAQPDRREERKGPRVGAPEAAVAGFLKSAGLQSLDQAEKVSDGKKGEIYVAVVEKKGRATAKVVLDADRRKAMILADAKSLAFANGLDLVEDEGLLEEVAGLVEWPVVLMGEFAAEFLELPPEAIRATIRANQKCFVARDGAGKLANKFVLVANLVA